VSAAVRDQVGPRLDGIGFNDLGEQSLKNITRPVRVFQVSLDVEKPSERDSSQAPHLDLGSRLSLSCPSPT
jgi:adenylate cyclase